VEFGSPEFWVAVVQIIIIDLLLGGDNAVVIALACRNLPEKQRKLGIMWGVAGAITLRVILTIFAVTLLSIPYLKIVGAVLLAWIAIKLVMPDEGGGGHEIDASDSLTGAIKTIIIADLVMSLDNVLAVAGAAKDSWTLIIFGLVVSIPIIVYCSTLVLKLMDRFPMVIVAGGMLLGWIAGTMAVTDPAVVDWMPLASPTQPGKMPEVEALVRYGAGIAGALLVLAVGKGLARRAAT